MASFTDCETSRDSTYDVTLAERLVGSFRSSGRKKSPLLPLSCNNITYLDKDNSIASTLSHVLPLRSCLILSSYLGLQTSNVLLLENPKNMLRILYVIILATWATCPWFHDANNIQWISTKIWEAPQRVIFSTVVLILLPISGPNTPHSTLFHNIVNPFSSIISTCYSRRRNTVCGHLHLS